MSINKISSKISSLTSSVLAAFAFSGCGAGVNFQGTDYNSYDSNGDIVIPYKQNVNVKAEADVDILFIVDNSGSMEQEQVGFANKINGFMSVVKDLNWRVALTTTDPNIETKDKAGVKRAWGDGQFRPFDSDTGTEFFMDSKSTSLSSAQAKLSNAIDVGLAGSGAETSISIVYRAIERRADTEANKNFFRPNARLIVIAISDEDECGGAVCLSALKSSPEGLVSFVKSEFGTDKIFAFNSLSRAKADKTCSTAVVTPIYEAMSVLTGGIIGSVCANDYTASLSSMAQRTVELVRSASLSCEPQDMDGDGDGDVIVSLNDGSTRRDGYTIANRLLTFDAALPEGTHTLSYFCALPN